MPLCLYHYSRLEHAWWLHFQGLLTVNTVAWAVLTMLNKTHWQKIAGSKITNNKQTNCRACKSSQRLDCHHHESGGKELKTSDNFLAKWKLPHRVYKTCVFKTMWQKIIRKPSPQPIAKNPKVDIFWTMLIYKGCFALQGYLIL